MNEVGTPSPDPRLSPARTKWFALGALAVAAAAFLFIAIGGIGENLVYYWGPKELRAAGSKATGATIRLGGQVATATYTPMTRPQKRIDPSSEDQRLTMETQVGTCREPTCAT